jgi:hypothetical protein
MMQVYTMPMVYDQIRDPGYVYPILLTGMVFFMASNVMRNLLPEAQRVMCVTPWSNLKLELFSAELNE